MRFNPYDKLAPVYRQYAQKKAKYLKTVDRLILAHSPKNSSSLLDIGAGDGQRGMSIGKKLKIKTIYLSDSSLSMVQKCRMLKPSKAWQVKAEDLDCQRHFDIILCLWNVLGHIESKQRRVSALKKTFHCLSDKGILFLDVQNRHNVSAYGILKVIGRVIIDTIYFKEKRGDARYQWQIGEKSYQGTGHLFIPNEIETLVKDGGLTIKKRFVINYNTGKVSQNKFQGQLFYVIRKK